ncbi:MAG: glycosyltransferase family 2 protein [Lachnospiraceae bacterium]|nr:glycosyltransferase family 2 protein [Lachnospiraceae bacterium]
MITISVCMIVKNEEQVLARCLDSLQGIADEIVIVDTGSTDRTKEIAAEYTDRIYDFVWVDDFSAARNFAFSKATKEYIYSADADEVLEEEDRRKFLQLKQVLLPEIEIVEMIYVNPEDCNAVYNYNREPRPKLFRRLRTFRWIDPVHETVATDPIVYSSEIEIQHRPLALHTKRDLAVMEKTLKKHGRMSDRLFSMYAKELFISGEPDDFTAAVEWFRVRSMSPEITVEKRLEAVCVVAKAYAMKKAWEAFLALVLPEVSGGSAVPAELYFLLGNYYEGSNPAQAAEWYRKAALEAENYICISYGGETALKKAIRLLMQEGRTEEAEIFASMLENK